MKYCRELKFEEQPDYELLTGLLKKIISENSNSANPDYDWNDKLKSSTDYDIDKKLTYKKPNVSMALNNKSTNSPYEMGIDDTGISPNKRDLSRGSIFQKDDK
jgi:hypothetical protein